MLRVLDLFSGIGGFSLGLERTGGFETVASCLICEIDENCRSVLLEEFSGRPVFQDIRHLVGWGCGTLSLVDHEQHGTFWDVGPINVISGGFPCQDISTSGTKEGLDGERSGLWHELARIIGEIRPKYVIVENSPNLLVGGNGEWFGKVLGDLAALGYDAEWHIIPASAVGAPHRRERVWIIAYPPGVGQSRPRGLLQSINSAPDAYRGASGLVNAVQRDAVPFLCQRHDGVPKRVAETALHQLGNAIVPQIAEQIGHAILAAEAAE